MPGLSLAFLGTFRAEFNGRSLSHFRTKTVQALLIYLTCQPEAHQREHLMALLWPGMPQPSAQKNLRQSLYLLRQAIPEVPGKDSEETVPFLLADRQTIGVNPDGRYDLDCQAFAECLKQDESSWPQAMTLYRGAFLADFYLADSAPFEEWVQARRGHWRRQVLGALETLTEQALTAGNLKTAEQYARRQLEIDNLRESAHRQLIAILARDGRRVDALSQYESLVHLLQTELGVEPSADTQSIAEAIRSDNFDKVTGRHGDKVTVTPSPPHHVNVAPPHNLPAQPTPLIGREAELADLDKLVMNQGRRLVTIVGPGGMGKTRLAIAFAEGKLTTDQLDAKGQEGRFPDGAFIVKLAPLASVDHIVPTIAQALDMQLQPGESPRQQILNYLQHKKMLLICDNFEHLLAGVELLPDILSKAADVFLLVTSRERLKLQAEQVYPIKGLAYREWQTTTNAELDGAARLFLNSASRAVPDFSLKPEDLTPLWQICQLVQGMPLGLIMAAAWVELLSPAEIAAEMRGNLDMLEVDYFDLPERQRSMQVVFRTTWERLSSTERAILKKISIFRGGFSVEAARTITDASLPILMRLVDKTILISTGNGRFEIHELLRQFAAEELSQTPNEKELTSQQHANYYCQLLHTHESDLKGKRIEHALAQIRDDIENIHIAWKWAAQKEQALLTRQVIYSLARFFLRTCRLQEGLDLFGFAEKNLSNRIDSIIEMDPDKLLLQTQLLAWQSAFLFKIGSLMAAEKKGQEALTILDNEALERKDIRYERALILLHLAHAFDQLGHEEVRLSYLEESMVLFEDLGETRELAIAWMYFGDTAVGVGKYELAIKRYSEARLLYQGLGDKRDTAEAQLLIGYYKMALDQFVTAEELIRSSINDFQEVQDRFAEGIAFSRLGQLKMDQGEFEAARPYMKKGVTLISESGMKNRAFASNLYWCWATMHLGEYELAQAVLRKNLNIVEASKYIWGIGVGFFVEGCICLAQSKKQAAKKRLYESIIQLQSIDQREELSQAMTVLSILFSKEGDLTQAKQYLIEALPLAQEIHSSLIICYPLSAAALFLAKCSQPVRAIEVYDRIYRNPYVANSKWFEDVVGKEIKTLKENMLPNEVKAAVDQGQEVDVWETAALLLTELKKEE